jgi:hypothetical protein
VEAFHGTVLSIFQEAVARRDPHRASLVLVPVEALTISLIHESSATSQRIAQVDLLLNRMLRTILRSDDFQLFKELINSMSLSIVLESQEQLLSELDAITWRAVSELHLTLVGEIGAEIEALRFAMRFTSAIQFDSIPELPRRFESILSSVRSEQTDELVKEFRAKIFALYTNYLTLRTFFLASVNTLFQFNQRKIDASSYLTELWHHTTPQDADGITLNVTPVPTDPLWLSILYLYGGVLSGFWETSYYFEDFHGISKYVVESFLLGLAKLGKPIQLPLLDIKKLADYGRWSELGEFYQFAQSFVRQVSMGDFTRELESLPALQLDAFVNRGRPVAPDGMTWHQQLIETIENAKTAFNEVIGFLETNFPLDDGRVRECRSQIRSAYESASRAGKAGVLTPCTAEEDLRSLTDFSNPFPPVQKTCLIKAAGNVDCTMIWHDIGTNIALQEVKHIYNVSRSAREPSRVIETYDSNALLTALTDEVAHMQNEGLEPSLVFLPLKLVSDWWTESRVEYNQMRLVLSSTTLDYIHSVNVFEFNDIVILDANRCKWLHEVYGDGRLQVSATPSVPSRTVRIDARTRGRFQAGPDAIRIIEVSAVAETGRS